MAWNPPENHPYVSGEVVSAATLNTFVRENLQDLDRRTRHYSAGVTIDDEQTSSTTFTDLPTVGPSVTVEVGTSGLLMVLIHCRMTNASTADEVNMGIEISGATADPAQIRRSIGFSPRATLIWYSAGTVAYWTTLNPGIHTVTAKYRCNGGTGRFRDRFLTAVPLGS